LVHHRVVARVRPRTGPSRARQRGRCGCDRSPPEQLADLTTAYGERIFPLPLDVTRPAAAAAAIAAARQRFGRLDVVANNAGYANVAPIKTGDDEDFRAQFETNFCGVYNVSKPAIPVVSLRVVSPKGSRLGLENWKRAVGWRVRITELGRPTMRLR
jgi:NAD(P)-dependent dehydrogenase (short-subunit alcohol dehydrogenase family)